MVKFTASALGLLALVSSAQASFSLVRRQNAPVHETCANSETIAMTFDDGPYQFLDQILDHYASANQKASFFLNGQNWGCIYDYADGLRRAFDEGHLIGSHTWSHIDITTVSAEELNTELERVEEALGKILGIRPTFFRPPYGNVNDAALRVLGERGYTVVTWDHDTGDSVGTPPEEAMAALDELAGTFPAPHMTLSHETHQATAEQIVPHAIQVLTDAGYQLQTANECLNIDAPYEVIGEPGQRDETWVC